MELFEYIKSQLPQMPNSAIMKQALERCKQDPNRKVTLAISQDGLSDIDDLYLESHAYEINNKINNNDIRNMPFSDYN